MRNHILSEIQRLAKEVGEAPGQRLFARETGIAEHQWRGKFWARWGDALTDAGYGPNEWNQRLETTKVLLMVIEACRHYRKLPTSSEINLYRQAKPEIPDIKTIRSHFGSRADLVAALANYVSENEGYADIVPMLPSIPKVSAEKVLNSTKSPEGFVYLIKSGDFYKVGRSDDIERRIKEIRIALPDKATLVHSIRTDDPSGIEAYWHNRFNGKRVNGEWFKLSPLELAAFKKRKYQ